MMRLLSTSVPATSVLATSVLASSVVSLEVLVYSLRPIGLCDPPAPDDPSA